MQNKWKGAELAAKRLGKGLHKVFKVIVNELNNALPTLGESGAEVSYFITEPMNFVEVTRLPADFTKSWLKVTFKYIKNLIKKSDISNVRPIEGRFSDTMYECLKANI